MKTLAIIPAAEGLETLPNRNMRAINGRPLIYYAINNAKKSKYVDDIIVTTNSDEVVMLAEQLGDCKCYRRPAKLCGIDVPLEKVINHVRTIVDFESYDYIVTMQSISVTLRAETLDKALEECEENRIDTMISVVERRNYFWKKGNEGYITEQKDRVCKSHLEPFYMETGAFFISRPQYISDDSRIGGKTSLYILDSDEAIDVTTFGDLKQAEYVLSKKKIAFYVNGNSIMGMGHIMRVMMLADEFFVKPTIFYDFNKTDREVFGNSSYEIVGVDGLPGLTKALKEGSYTLLINDILETNESYMKALRRELPKMKIVNFEDDGAGAKYADLVINALYNEKDNGNWKAGADYYIAPKQYLLQRPIAIRKRIKRVLVTFGGADPSNYTDQVLKIIVNPKLREYQFDVVIGPANRNQLSFSEEDLPSNIKLHYNVNGLLSLMQKSDMAISSRGRTGFELAICGIPTICMAQNERETRHDFMSEKNGFTYLGYRPSDIELDKAIRNMLSFSAEARLEIQKKMQRKSLKNGRRNIIDLINSL